MENKRAVKKTESGFIALTSVLIIGAVVLVLGVSLFHSALTDYSISSIHESGQEAAFLADFCVKEGVLRLKEDIDYSGGEEIKFNDMICYINLVEDVEDTEGNTKKVSAFGRAGDQPHFSRSSQLIRYVIESSASDWDKGESYNLKIDVDNNSLKLDLSEVIEDRPENWGDYHYFDEEKLVIQDGSLMLILEEPKRPDGDPCDNPDQCLSAHCYVDADGDRYAPSSGTKRCQASSQLAGTDCCDTDDDAYPGQTSCFSTPCVGCSGSGGYDYNCSGASSICSEWCTYRNSSCSLAAACGQPCYFLLYKGCGYAGYTAECN